MYPNHYISDMLVLMEGFKTKASVLFGDSGYGTAIDCGSKQRDLW